MARRKRLTITLRDDLLRGVDAVVDRANIRNRSHAIEVLLQRALGHGLRQAVILAAGEGVRLRPFTYELPKSLLPVGGRPLVAHTLTALRDHGIRDIVIIIGHLGDRIAREFGSGEALGLDIHYARQDRPTGTGGALRAAQALLRNSPFLCVYGDILAEIDYTDLIRTHQASHGTVATIALTSVADPSAYGAVRLHGTRVAEFLEKPTRASDVSRLIYAGISVLDEEIFAFLPEKKVVSMESDVFPALLKRHALTGYPFEGAWFDVSTAAIYEKVLKHWERKKNALP